MMLFKNVSSVTWISTHLFKFYFKIILASALVLPIASADSDEIILQDKFVFKIANEVLSLKDLKRTKKNIEDLKCMYPESLVHKIFSQDFSGGRLNELKVGTEFNQKDVKYFEKLIPFFKLLAYSKSHDVSIQPSLPKYFRLSATQKKCDLSLFDEKEFIKSFEPIVRLEVFVRSRFLPSESQGKSSVSDVEKAVIGARNLITSIDQQIDEEAYW